MDIQPYHQRNDVLRKKEILEEREPGSWLKTVSAFANGAGGMLLFGVADDDSLVGLSDVRTAGEKISEAIKDKTDPSPTIKIGNPYGKRKEFYYSARRSRYGNAAFAGTRRGKSARTVRKEKKHPEKEGKLSMAQR